MAHNPVGMWQQKHLTMMKHAHRASNLAKKMSILLECSIKNMEQFLWELNAYNFRICMH